MDPKTTVIRKSPTLTSKLFGSGRAWSRRRRTGEAPAPPSEAAVRARLYPK